MKRRDQPAAIGSSTIGVGWYTPTSEAAREALTFSLAGSTSSDAATPHDPIVAARRWLEHPQRGGRLHPVLRDRASAAVDVAERHMRRLVDCTARLATEFETSGTTNPELIAMANDHANTLERFGTRLRMILDPDVIVPDATDRIERGLAAARTGGLDALVDAL